MNATVNPKFIFNTGRQYRDGRQIIVADIRGHYLCMFDLSRNVDYCWDMLKTPALMTVEPDGEGDYKVVPKDNVSPYDIIKAYDRNSEDCFTEEHRQFISDYGLMSVEYNLERFTPLAERIYL